MKEVKFTKKDLKLIKESLMAYGVGEDEEDSKIYDKISKLINKPVTTTNEQPKTGLHFEQDELNALYHLLNRTNSREYLDDLDVFLERIAFCLKG